MTTTNSTLVGVFNESAQAERAIEQLHNAGIPDGQITYSGSVASAGSGFVAAIKSFFTGNDVSTNANTLFKDLTEMGLSREEAQYYAMQYQSGRTILAVHPGDQWQNVQTILTSNGSFSYTGQNSGLGTQSVRADYPQSGSSYGQNTTPDYTRSSNPTYNQSGQGDYAQAGNPNYNPSDQTKYAQTGDPTYNQAGRVDYTQAGSQNYNQPGQTNYANTSSPSYNQAADYAQTGNPNYGQSGPTDYAQGGSPDYTQPGQGTYVRPGSQNYERMSEADRYNQTNAGGYDPTGQGPDYQTNAGGYNPTGQGPDYQTNTGYDPTTRNAGYQSDTGYDPTARPSEYRQGNAYNDPTGTYREKRPTDAGSTWNQDQTPGNQQRMNADTVTPENQPAQNQPYGTQRQRRQETYVDNEGNLQKREYDENQDSAW